LNRAALALWRIGRERESELLLTEAVNGGQANDDSHAVLGAIFLGRRAYPRARSEVDAPSKRGNPAALVVAAHADLMLRDFRKAIDELKPAAEKTDGPEGHYVSAI